MKLRSLSRVAPIVTALGAAIAVTAAPSIAHAQFPGGGMSPGMGGMGPGGMGGMGSGMGNQRKKPQPKQEGPETHAASGADDAPRMPTQEPTLPEDPLALPKASTLRLGTDSDPQKWDFGRTDETRRRFYGPYYSEESGKYRFRTLFPLWAERTMPGDRTSLITPFYFQRRSQNHDADVLFPLFWRLRNFDTTTTIVGPWGSREKKATKDSPGRSDSWLAPFVFQGKSDDGSAYFHIPPLLTFMSHDKKGGFNMAGPAFCKWQGGSVCDPRTADKLDMGVAPLYFFGKDETSEYELMPPLLHYYSYSDVGDQSTNVWGPYVRRHSRENDSTWVLPFYYHSWAKNEDSLTIFPFVHYSYKGNSHLLATPLFVESKGEDGSSTFVTWGYARHRGRTELDMITPLYWEYRDPDIQLKRQVFFPFFYRSVSARSEDLAIFPFYGHFVQKGVSDTTWVTPLFRHKTDLTGWETDLFPFVFTGRDNQKAHTVVAPFFWDFSSPRSRTTIALPVFFRFEDEETISQDRKSTRLNSSH